MPAASAATGRVTSLERNRASQVEENKTRTVRSKEIHIGAADKLLYAELDISLLAGLSCFTSAENFAGGAWRPGPIRRRLPPRCRECIPSAPRKKARERGRITVRGLALERRVVQGAGARKLACSLPFSRAMANPPCRVVSWRSVRYRAGRRRGLRKRVAPRASWRWKWLRRWRSAAHR